MLAAQSGVGWGRSAHPGQPRVRRCSSCPPLAAWRLWSAPREEFAPLAPGSIAACYLGPQRLLVTLKDARGPRLGASADRCRRTRRTGRDDRSCACLIVQEVADAFGGDPAADRRAPSSDVIADTVWKARSSRGQPRLPGRRRCFSSRRPAPSASSDSAASTRGHHASRRRRGGGANAGGGA
ncbi:MAG: hypothetical protein U0575_01325 [Phycisphaerales bacterium]